MPYLKFPIQNSSAAEVSLFTNIRRTSSKLNTAEAASYLNIGRSTLEKLRLYGGGPIYSKPLSRRVVYELADLDAWVAASRRKSTTGGAAPPAPLPSTPTRSTTTNEATDD